MLFQDIYDHSKNVKKSKAYQPIAQTMGRWTAFSAIDKYLYRSKRRVVHRWFSDDTIKTFSPKMLSLIRTFCSQLLLDEGLDPGEWTRPKDMRDYCEFDDSFHRCSTDTLGHWLAFDIMGEFLVGQKYGTLKDPANRFMIDTIRDMNKRIGVYSQSPSLIYFGWDLIWSPITRDCRRRCMKWMKAMRTNLVSQYYSGSGVLDSTAVNPSSSTQKLGMPIEDISSEAQFLVAAGNHPNHNYLALRLSILG